MREYEALRRRADFGRTTRRGRRSAGAFLSCFVLDGRRRTRVGLQVSGAVGGAVVRNRLRRRLKALLDGYPLGVAPWRDIVLIARPGAGELTFAALTDELTRVFPRP